MTLPRCLVINKTRDHTVPEDWWSHLRYMRRRPRSPNILPRRLYLKVLLLGKHPLTHLRVGARYPEHHRDFIFRHTACGETSPDGSWQDDGIHYCTRQHEHTGPHLHIDRTEQYRLKLAPWGDLVSLYVIGPDHGV